MKPEEVKELLRQVPCPGRSRDIVALGFIHGIGVQGPNVMVEFKPDTTNVAKVLAMEEGIREVLRQAQFQDIELETEPPYDDDAMLLGGASTNPLQVDLNEYGIEPTPDIVEGDGQRARNLLSPEPPKDGSPAAQLAEDAPEEMGPDFASEEPQGNLDPTYNGPLPVFQWQIDPESAETEAVKTKLSVGSWNFVVCWLVHPSQDLVYASLQARHWISYGGKARPNPAGRTEGVNLVYDRKRAGVVAIYGTVKDFRPFVEAFRRAFTGETRGGGDASDAATRTQTPAAPAAVL
jgi:metal-sulfur cluster biosynthetic enzyme